MRWLVVVGLVLVAATVAGCTFSAGEDEPGGGDAPQIVTATLSEALRTLAGPDAVTPATEPAVVAVQPSPTLVPTQPATTPATTPASTLEAPTQAFAESTPTPAPTRIIPPTATSEPVTSTPDITATPTVPSATATPIPTLAPTRTSTGPTALPPLDDGSGNLILGTGDDVALNPLGSIEELPETLYFLSDVGGQVQVFRLRVGLNHPDQLTYSGAGVRAYSVAPDGTLAYADGTGNLIIGGIPVPLPQEAGGMAAQITSLAWSPGGDWLAYTVEGPESGGVWMRNREGTTEVQLAENRSGDDARTYIGPIDWQPGGETFIVRTRTPAGTPYTQIAIMGGSPVPLWDDGLLPPDAYTQARWNVNGNSVIVSGVDRVLRVEPDPFTVTELLSAEAGLTTGYADQWADGTLMFGGHTGDGAVRLYRLVSGTQTPVPISDVLVQDGRIEFLWDDVGQGMLLSVYDSSDAPVGVGLFRDVDGELYEMTPLTGAVGAPEWGPLFRLRDWARIRTMDGDALNVRAQPSLQAQIVIRLATGTRVAVIGGPRVAGGYRWWQVRSADGASGWAVESVQDPRGLELRTLLPVD